MSEAMKRIEQVRDAMVDRFGPEPPAWAMVLGSGVGGLTERLVDRVAVDYRALGLPGTDVVGHAGEVVVGLLEGVRVACLSGRNHLYEGHDPFDSVLGLRALLLWGAGGVILTSSVGSIRAEWSPGSIVMVRDHINLSGVNPLRGPNLPALGPRFPDMCQAYTPRLRKLARVAADTHGVDLHDGVYACMPGPTYETPAEIRFLRTVGADLVGMSVVHEAIVTVHAGRPLLAFCIVANPAAGLSDKLLDHQALTAAVSASVERLSRIVVQVVREG
jgi:inosine/guanosine/xanthosine phosphorylase family protein